MSVSDIERSYNSRLDQFSQLSATLKVDFGGDRLFVDGRVTPASISHADEKADCTVKISVSDLEKILSGELAASTAFATGKLKISGVAAVAVKFWALGGAPPHTGSDRVGPMLPKGIKWRPT